MQDKTVNLNLDQAAPPALIHVTQGDTMWRWHFPVWLDGLRWSIPTGAQAILKGTKPDGHVFAYTGSIAGNEIVVDCALQMTICAGPVGCTLIILDGDNKRLHVARIALLVAADPEATFDVASDSALPAYAEVLGNLGDLLALAASLPDDLPAYMTQAAEDWLEENIDPATGYVLDNSLTLSNAASPADKVGELRRQIYNSENVDLSSYTEAAKSIGSTGTWQPSGKSVFIERSLSAAAVSVTAQESQNALISFLTSNDISSAPQFATGETGRHQVDMGTTNTFPIPDDCTFINVQTRYSSGSNAPSDVTILSSKIVVLQDGQNTITGEIKRIENHILKDEVVALSTCTEVDKSIGSAGTWQPSGKSIFIRRLSYAAAVSITAQESLNAFISFLTSNDISSAPQFATGETGRHQVDMGTTGTFPIPDDCTFINIQTEYSSGSNAPAETKMLYDAVKMLFSVFETGTAIPKLWEFHGLHTSGSEVASEYNIIPDQGMTILVKCPDDLCVRFQYGVREYEDYTDYLYNGDVYTFDFQMVSVQAVISRPDGAIAVEELETLIRTGDFGIYYSCTDGNVIERNADCEKYALAMCATSGRDIPNILEKPVIVHTSDIHGDAERFFNVCAYTAHLGASLLINTGDDPVYKVSQGVGYIGEALNEYPVDYANCIGNHDQYASSTSVIYSKMIRPYASKYGYHKDSSSDVTDDLYYFKDLPDEKIRLIAVNIYDGLTTASYKARLTSAQINWFISTLANVPDEYGVIVLMHQAPHTLLPISGKTSFNSLNMSAQMGSIDSDYMRNGKITGNPFGKIIDAFINRAAISGTYTNTANSEQISYTADFSSVPAGAEFIMYLNGHVHCDYIGYVEDCTEIQLNCNVCSCVSARSNAVTSFTGNYDCMRGTHGVTQDAFNVYVIDREKKRVGIARIGSNMNEELTDRKCMWVNYMDTD